MKKALSPVLVFLFVTLFAVCCAAQIPGFGEGAGSFSLVTYHNPYLIVGSEEGANALDASADGILTAADTYRVRMVSFLGSVTGGTKTGYDYVLNQGHSMEEYQQVSANEETFNKSWQTIADLSQKFHEAGMGRSVSLGINDNLCNSMFRMNILYKYLPFYELYPDDTEFGYCDDANSWYRFEEGGTGYIVMTLEIWPRQTVLDWASEVLNEHCTDRVILITTSFMNASGKMYHEWDWDELNKLSSADRYSSTVGIYNPEYTTSINGLNIFHADQPRDGDALWNYFINKFNNIFLVLCSYGGSKEITAKVFQNSSGYDVLAVCCQTAAQDGAVGALLTGISGGGSAVKLCLADMKKKTCDPASVQTFQLHLADLTGLTPKTLKTKLVKQIYGQNTAYVNGYGDGSFQPDAFMTRAEAVTIVARLIDAKEHFRGQYTCDFADAKPGDWYYDYIAFAQSAGLLDNYTGSFLPEQNITRGGIRLSSL